MLKIIKYILTILLIPIFILIFIYKGMIEILNDMFYDTGCAIISAIDYMYKFWFGGDKG